MITFEFDSLYDANRFVWKLDYMFECHDYLTCDVIEDTAKEFNEITTKYTHILGPRVFKREDFYNTYPELVLNKDCLVQVTLYDSCVTLTEYMRKTRKNKSLIDLAEKCDRLSERRNKMITFKFDNIFDRNEFIQRVDRMFLSPLSHISIEDVKEIACEHNGSIILSGPIDEFNLCTVRRDQWSWYVKEDSVEGLYFVKIPTDTAIDSALSFPTRYDKISTALPSRHIDYSKISTAVTLLNNSIRNMFHQPYNVEKVIFNDPATIVFWEDGIKTVVKCGPEDKFDKEKGLAMAYVKKMFGNKGNYFEMFKTWCRD